MKMIFMVSIITSVLLENKMKEVFEILEHVCFCIVISLAMIYQRSYGYIFFQIINARGSRQLGC